MTDMNLLLPEQSKKEYVLSFIKKLSKMVCRKNVRIKRLPIDRFFSRISNYARETILTVMYDDSLS